MELEAGEEKVIRWVIFPHEGKEDFLKKAGEYNPHFVDVRADRYVLFPGEKSVLTIRPAFQAEQVSVNGEALTEEDGITLILSPQQSPVKKSSRSQRIRYIRAVVCSCRKRFTA